MHTYSTVHTHNTQTQSHAYEGRGLGGKGGARGKVYSKPTRGAATSDDDDVSVSEISQQRQC